MLSKIKDNAALAGLSVQFKLASPLMLYPQANYSPALNKTLSIAAIPAMDAVAVWNPLL